MEFFNKLPMEIKSIIKYYVLQCVHHKTEIQHKLCTIMPFTDCVNINHLVFFNKIQNRITRTYICDYIHKYNCREYSPVNTYQISLEHDDDEYMDYDEWCD